MAQWIEPGLIAINARPGYGPGAEFSVSRAAVDAWVADARAAGITSIICLLDLDQLPLYDRALPGGLLAHYAASGFTVSHLPTPDGQAEPYTPAQLEHAWREFQRLPKPVLIHCSAGYDRTGRIVAHLRVRLANAAHAG